MKVHVLCLFLLLFETNLEKLATLHSRNFTVSLTRRTKCLAKWRFTSLAKYRKRMFRFAYFTLFFLSHITYTPCSLASPILLLPLVARNAINNSRYKRTAIIAVAAQGYQKDADDTRRTRSYETKKRRLVSETQHLQDDVKLWIAKLGRSKAVVNVGSLENEKVRAREMFSVDLY